MGRQGQRLSNEPKVEMVDNKPLSVGMVIDAGTPQANQWVDLAGRLVLALNSVPVTEPELEVNVVFLVPAAADRPLDFTGCRTGRLNRRTRTLIVQVAVPFDPPDGAVGFMWQEIFAAIDLAEDHARRKRLATDLTSAREMAAAGRRNTDAGT